MKKRQTIIISSLLTVFLVMTAGYAAFTSKLTINGTSQIVGKWDIRITDVKVLTVAPNCDAGTPSFTNDNVTFNASLNKPGDVITYLVTIENKGTIDATLSGISFLSNDEKESPDIIYSVTDPKKDLPAQSETSFRITVTYNPDTKEIPNQKTKTIIGTINYVQKY